MPLHLLLVEDDLPQARALIELFERWSSDTVVTQVNSLKATIAKVGEHFDVVILDLGLPDSQGLHTVDAVHERFPNVPIVVLTATSEEELGCEAIEHGADDYLEKGIIPAAAIRRVVRYALARQRAEEALRASRRDMHAILDHVRDAIMFRDFDGIIHFWNQGAVRLYGWTPSEVIGLSSFDLLYGGDDERVREAHRCALTFGEWQGELVQYKRDGLRVTVESRWSVLHVQEGGTPLLLVINTDVTEMRSLERQLLHAQRLESLGTLASGMAHDLNNILMPIMMGSDYLRRSGIPPAAERTVEQIGASARRAAELVRQMLTFARGHRVENEMTNPARLVEELARILHETLPPSIHIQTEANPELWSVACDPTQVHQVLLNLCVNARDAMPRGGTLRIAAQNVQVDEQYARMNVDARPGAYVMLSVSDTGAGIPRESLGKIFEPFYTTKDPGAGTGLGLATVRSIVRNHSGFINVYSEPGQTVFKIYLPALHEPPPEAERGGNELKTGHGELVLVIDDESAIRETIAATLRSYGYRVIVAADGSEGIALYAQNPETAVVLTDMLMPLVDGSTTVRALRRVDPQLKVIGMSGAAARENLEHHGFDGILQKPFNAADLLSVLDEVLSQGHKTNSAAPLR